MATFDGVRAVIIEDDAVSADVLQKLLGYLNVDTVVIPGNARTPDYLADTSRPDVIFLDLEMPGYNGYEILSILRDDAEFDGVPIVAYTTHISHMNDARQAGFDSFLGKPLRRFDFANQLARILNGESVWDAT